MLYKQLSFMNMLPPKDTLIVDFGCRDGRLLDAFYKDGYSAVAIDSDPERIVEAKIAMPNAKFTCADIRTTFIPKGFLILRFVLPFLIQKKKSFLFLKRTRTTRCTSLSLVIKMKKVLHSPGLGKRLMNS
jgi:trans-aconitate methyltransferase